MELIGRTLGPYRIEAHVGRGGAADVYRAVHVELGRAVALKVLFEDSSEDAEQIARFQRESRVLARLSHPGIVEVHDCGSEGTLHYFAMALLEHRTLAALLDAHGTAGGWLPVPQLVAIVSSILEVLTVVHAENIIHRDLKPSNIFVTGDDQAIVSDFGLVKVIDEGTLTARPDAVFGTLQYMAPEQILSEPADARTDLYAVGLLLYRLLYGRLPFGDAMAEIVQKKTLSAGFKPPVPAPREVPAALVTVLERACRRDRRERFPEAAQFLAALEGLSLVSRPISARTPVVRPLRTIPKVPRPTGLSLAAGRRARRVRVLVRAGLVLGVALLASVVVGLLLRVALPGQRGEPPRVGPAPGGTPSPAGSAGGAPSSAAAEVRQLAAARDLAHEIENALGSECTKVLIASMLAVDLSKLAECYDREADRLGGLEVRLTALLAPVARAVESGGRLPARAAQATLTLHRFLLGCRKRALAGARTALAHRPAGNLTSKDLAEEPPLLAADPEALSLLTRHLEEVRELARAMAERPEAVEAEAGVLVDDVRVLARLATLSVWAPEAVAAARDHLRLLPEAASRAPAPVGPALAQALASVRVLATHGGRGELTRATVRAAIEDLAGLRAVLPGAHAGLTPILADAWRDMERAAP